MSSDNATRFHWADYLVFAVTLGLSAAVGVFYAIKDRKKTSTETFLMGDRRIHFVPVSLSILVSFISAISLIALPVDIYSYGSLFYGFYFSYIIAIPIAAHLIIPVLHRLKVKSMYEYLELRYNRTARVVMSLAFILTTLCFMGIALYVPSLAFSQVTGTGIEISILAVGIVCTFYTVLGGMKAVVWTDTLQAGLMLIGLLAISIQTTIQIGGFTVLWERAVLGGRIIKPNADFFTFDPTVRYSFWGLCIGFSLMILSLYSANQMALQRYLSIQKLSDVKKAIYLNIPTGLIFGTIMCYIGLAAYAYFYDCDPFLSGKITKQDQLIPFMIMEVLGFLPGIPGLVLTGVFSAALSTISSGLNSLTVIILEDLIKPLLWRQNVSVSDKKEFILSKLLVVVVGAAVTALSFVPSLLDKTVLQIGLTTSGVINGPVLGVMVLAILVPFSNSWGAVCGLLVGCTCAGWIGIGGILYPSSQPVLGFRTDGCYVHNASLFKNETSWFSTTSAIETTELQSTAAATKEIGFSVKNLYSMSYVWMTALGFSVTMVAGIVASLIFSIGQKKDTVDPELVVHIFDKICCYLPEGLRRLCRCGVHVYEEQDQEVTGNEIKERHKENISKPFVDNDNEFNPDDVELHVRTKMLRQ